MLTNQPEKKSGIYIITNSLNNKRYIGSAVNLYNRKYHHFTELKQGKHKNPHLQASYNKYGKEVFSFSTLELVDNKTKLIEREQYYLDILNPEYNIKKIADSSLGLKRDPEKVKILTQKLKDLGHYKKLSKMFKGHKVTKETKNKIGSANSKIIIVTDTLTNEIKEYKSATEFARTINKDPAVITKCCRWNKICYKRYWFKYKQ